MQTAIYLTLTVIHGIALYFIFKLFMKQRVSYTFLALLAIFGLFYDNLIISMGSFIGEGDALQALNAGRFYVHALITPLIIIYAYGVIRQVMGKGKYDKLWHSVFCLLATALIFMGASTEIVNLSLVPELENGTLRYVNEAAHGPPIPSIIAIIMMIIVGIMMWRHMGWPWLALGSIVMFVAAGVGVNFTLLANMGEVIFVIAIVTMDYRIHLQPAIPNVSSPEVIIA